MRRIFATLSTAFKPTALVYAAILFAGTLSFFQNANAATAYYVSGTYVYARARAGGHATGRLYKDERMDIQYIDPEGWAYGFLAGNMGRCGWAQFRENGSTKFWTNNTTVPNRCRTTNIYLDLLEYSNGEVWNDSKGADDGVVFTLPRETHMWDNWQPNKRWGYHAYRGKKPAGSRFKVRYTTSDGGGVMARFCDSSGCDTGWVFIQRSALDTIHCGYLNPGEGLGNAQTLNSCDGRFSLTMQQDGNLVLYRNPIIYLFDGAALWSSNTPGNNRRNTSVFMQGDGNLVVYNDPFISWTPIWNSGTPGYWNSWLALQNDGNMVLYYPGGSYTWNSQTCCY